MKEVAGEYKKDNSEYKAGLHQGSDLIPFLFNIIFDVMTGGVKRGVPWDIMYADHLVIFGESK